MHAFFLQQKKLPSNTTDMEKIRISDQEDNIPSDPTCRWDKLQIPEKTTGWIVLLGNK